MKEIIAVLFILYVNWFLYSDVQCIKYGFNGARPYNPSVCVYVDGKAQLR